MGQVSGKFNYKSSDNTSTNREVNSKYTLSCTHVIAEYKHKFCNECGVEFKVSYDTKESLENIVKDIIKLSCGKYEPVKILDYLEVWFTNTHDLKDRYLRLNYGNLVKYTTLKNEEYRNARYRISHYSISKIDFDKIVLLFDKLVVIYNQLRKMGVINVKNDDNIHVIGENRRIEERVVKIINNTTQKSLDKDGKNISVDDVKLSEGWKKLSSFFKETPDKVLIQDSLRGLGIKFVTNVTHDKLKYKKNLRCAYYLYELSIVIESMRAYGSASKKFDMNPDNILRNKFKGETLNKMGIKFLFINFNKVSHNMEKIQEKIKEIMLLECGSYEML